MKKQYLLLTLILLFLSIGAFSPFGCKTTITGKITDSDTDSIEGAIVTLEGYKPVTTNSEGIYTIEDVPYGTYIISVSSTGYVTKSSETITTSYFETGITCKDTDGVNIQLGYICWREIGEGSASGNGISDSSYSEDPSIEINSSGNIIVAWDGKLSGNYDIYLKRWNGSAWEELDGSATGGGISNNSGRSQNLSLAIDDSGYPAVAWEDNTSGDNEIYIKRWNGSAWEELGGSATGGGISNKGVSSDPTLAINSQGNPIVAWSDYSSGQNEIYVKQWNGTTWEEIGTGSASGGGTCVSTNPSLAIDTSGNPIVTWENTPVLLEEPYFGTGNIYIKKWNGSNWIEISSGSATGEGISNSRDSTYPSLITNNTGNPVVVWKDTPYSFISNVYLKQWNGTTWEELGGSATEYGISDTRKHSYRPSIVLNDSNNLVLAWGESLNDDSEIYLKQWNGSSWEELDSSASGGGISNNSTQSSTPAVAINISGYPVVVWVDLSNYSNNGIYIKQYVPNE